MRRLPTTHYPLPTSRSGFTAIELMIVVGIVAVVAAVSGVLFTQYRSGKNISLSLDELAAVIQATQRRSMTQEGSAQWGIRFVNPTSTLPDTYTVFKGKSYAGGTIDHLYALSRNIGFSEPYPSSTFDMLFAPVTGTVSPAKIISITEGANTSFLGDLVVTALGRVTTRLENGIVGYWHFDEGAGTTVFDASFGTTSGLLQGGVARIATACKAGGCLQFDGISGYASTTPTVRMGKDITVLVWAKSSVPFYNTFGWIAGYRGLNGFVLHPNSGTTSWTAYLIDSTGAYTTLGSASFADITQWHQYGLVYDAAAGQGYVVADGQFVATYNGPVPRTASVVPVEVGRDYSFTNRYGLGTVDEMRIYSRALSQSEVQARYNDLK